jgi:hypothetical protein
VVLEGPLEEGSPCPGHAEPFLVGNALELFLDYGIDPKDEMDGSTLAADVSFGLVSFCVRCAIARRFGAVQAAGPRVSAVLSCHTPRRSESIFWELDCWAKMSWEKRGFLLFIINMSIVYCPNPSSAVS